MPKKAFINALDIRNAYAASHIAPGCLVARSADGTIAVNTATTDEQYMGAAGDRTLSNDSDPGFFSQYDTVPIAVLGTVRLNLIGGGSDCTNGMYLQAQADGLVAIESSGNKTTQSVAKCVDSDDLEVSDYTTLLDADEASGQTSLTVVSTVNFAAGDYVQIKDDSSSELALIKSIDSATQVTIEKALTNSYTTAANAEMNKLVQCMSILL